MQAMTIERYAEICAEIETGGLRDDVLSRTATSPDAWAASQREWLEKMAHELTRGRFELSNRYTRAFLDRQRTLLAATPARPAAIGTAGAFSGPTPSSTAVAPNMAAPPSMAIAPSVAVSPNIAPPPSAAVSPNMAPPPSMTAPSAVVAAPPPVAPAPKIGETVAADELAAAVQRALPFAGGPPGASIAKSQEAAPKTPLRSGTVAAFEVSASAPTPFEQPVSKAGTAPPPSRAARPATIQAPLTPPPAQSMPFERTGSADPDEAARNAKKHADEVQGPARPRSALSGETVSPSDLASVMKRVMPFGASDPTQKAPTPPTAAAPPTASAPPVTAPPPAAAAPPPPHSTPAQPAPLPSVAPPHPAAVPAPRALTLEQYASFYEDLAAAGPRAEEVLRRYGLTPGDRRALDEQWGQRFRQDPNIILAWEAARKTYRAWRKQQG